LFSKGEKFMLFQNRSNKLFNQGMELLNRGQYPEAIKFFSEDISANGVSPKNIGSCINRGFAYFCMAYDMSFSDSRGLDEQINKYLNQAVNDFSEAIHTFTFRTERTGEAINDWADTHFKRANANFFLHKPNEAIDDYSEAIKLQGKNPEYYMRRGFVYTEYIGDASAGLENYSKAIALSPTADMYLYRAWANLDLENTQKTKDDFHSAIRLDPNAKNGRRVFPIVANYTTAFDKMIEWEEFKQSLGFPSSLR
jgi:tetratricopeptide (TPR) repeat protein